MGDRHMHAACTEFENIPGFCYERDKNATNNETNISPFLIPLCYKFLNKRRIKIHNFF